MAPGCESTRRCTASFNQLAAGAEAFLYGRKVYEVMIPYWPDAVADASKPAHEREYGRLWVDKPKVVVSSDVDRRHAGTRAWCEPDAMEQEVARLEARVGRTTSCVTGARQLVSALQERGLVDEYALFVHPSALGAGVPFFRGRVELNLIDVRRFACGTLGLRYASAATSTVGG